MGLARDGEILIAIGIYIAITIKIYLLLPAQYCHVVTFVNFTIKLVLLAICEDGRKIFLSIPGLQ